MDTTTARTHIQSGADTPHSKVLHVLCRTLDQLRAVLAHGERKIDCDFQDIREYREAVKLAHEAGAEILIATPRIQKPDEVGLFRSLLKHGHISASPITGLFITWLVARPKTRSLSVAGERFYEGLCAIGTKQVREGIWQAAL